MTRELHRGEVWWADLPEPRGSEPGFRRPVLVIQSDGFNRSRIETIIVASITSNRALAEAPGNVLVPSRTAGLPRASVVNVSQLFTLDRMFFSERIGVLPADLLATIDAGLRRVLGL